MSDPFSVVEEAIGMWRYKRDREWDRRVDEALAALASIEERLREETRIHIAESARANAEKNRADRAEAERDKVKLAVLEYENCITWDTTCKNCAKLMDTNYAQYVELKAAEQRVAELEVALRRIISDGEFSPHASSTHFGRIARRALERE